MYSKIARNREEGKERVSRSPKVVGGVLVFAETRVPVEVLVQYLAAGDSPDLFLEHFPGVSRERAVAYLKMTPEAVALVTVRDRGRASKKNGDLLRDAQREFDALVTMYGGAIPASPNLWNKRNKRKPWNLPRASWHGWKTS